MNLSIRDAAAMLDLPEEKVFELARSGEMPCTRIDDQYLFSKMELLDWATTRKMQVSPSMLADTGNINAGLTESLLAGGIFHNVEGNDVASVLRSVVAHLRLPEKVDRDYLFQMMYSRETSDTTALGGGIAVPHTRAPIVLRIPKPTVTLSFLAHPVDFNAPDGKPVHTLFTIIGANVRTHLHLLSRLAWSLHDPGIKELIEKRAGEAELIEAFRKVEAAIDARGKR